MTKLFDKAFTFLLLALLITFLFIINHTVVNGDSMRNTYQTGDRLFLNLVDRNYNRGDIVTVFNDNKGAGFIPNSINTIVQVYGGKRVILVKRVIGLPGEEIEMIDKKIIIYNKENPKGVLINEDKYAKLDWVCVNNSSNPELSFNKYKIPEGSYYVMGDNRGCSQDSRYYKAFSKESILGKVILKLNWLW
jgi:signal peptidase I